MEQDRHILAKPFWLSQLFLEFIDSGSSVSELASLITGRLSYSLMDGETFMYNDLSDPSLERLFSD